MARCRNHVDPVRIDVTSSLQWFIDLRMAGDRVQLLGGRMQPGTETVCDSDQQFGPASS